MGRDVDDKNRVEVHLHFTHSLIANELSVADFRKRRTTEAGALCISSVDGDDLRMTINNSTFLAEFGHSRSQCPSSICTRLFLKFSLDLFVFSIHSSWLRTSV